MPALLKKVKVDDDQCLSCHNDAAILWLWVDSLKRVVFSHVNA